MRGVVSLSGCAAETLLVAAICKRGSGRSKTDVQTNTYRKSSQAGKLGAAITAAKADVRLRRHDRVKTFHVQTKMQSLLAPSCKWRRAGRSSACTKDTVCEKKINKIMQRNGKYEQSTWRLILVIVTDLPEHLTHFLRFYRRLNISRSKLQSATVT